MIDAAGAIYVIGGYGSSTHFRDVWASTDGGADGTHAGVLGGTKKGPGVLRGTIGGHYKGTRGFQDVQKGYQLVLRGP